MWKCPVCSNEENNINVCGKCGYDRSKDFVRYRTLSPVSQMDADELIKLISANDAEEQAKAAAAQALLEAMKREQEKKAEEERKAAEAARIERMLRIEEARRADEARRAKETRGLMSYRSELEKQREVQRKVEKDKDIYEALLKYADITEETLTRYERTVLFQTCADGSISLAKTLLDGYLEKHRNEAIEKEQSKSEVKNPTVMETSKVSSSKQSQKTSTAAKADKEKKTPIVFKIGIGCAIIGLGVFAAQSFKNSAKEPYTSEQMNALWKSIEQASIDALSSEMMDYEALTMEDLGANLASYGYSVSGPEWVSSEDEESARYSVDLRAALQDGEENQLGYEIICSDRYDDYSAEPYMRAIEFNENGNYSEYVGDENLTANFNSVVPLPMGIQWRDSFEAVCAKLGLTDADVGYGEYSYDDLYVSYTNDMGRGWIHLIGEKYAILFIFDGEENILENYWIDIY